MPWNFTGQIKAPNGKPEDGTARLRLAQGPARASSGELVDTSASPLVLTDGVVTNPDDDTFLSVPGAVWRLTLPSGHSVRFNDPGDGNTLDLGSLFPAGEPVSETEAQLLRQELATIREHNGVPGKDAEPPNFTVQAFPFTPDQAPDAAIVGDYPNLTIEIGVPSGKDGEPGHDGAPGVSPAISIGKVTQGTEASATITGVSPDLTLDLVIPSKGEKGDPGSRGNPGPAGVSSITPGQYELRGTGSPVGTVVPPAAGSYYTDIAGTCGAWRWMSLGTDSGSWIVTHGDTGRRNISSLVSGLSGGSVFIRRVNSWVTIDADDAMFQGLSGGNPLIPLVRGFHPSPTLVGAMFALEGSGGPVDQGLSRIDNISSGLRFSDAGSSLRLRDTRTWSTTEPWPATLPGTPS